MKGKCVLLSVLEGQSGVGVGLCMIRHLDSSIKTSIGLQWPRIEM